MNLSLTGARIFDGWDRRDRPEPVHVSGTRISAEAARDAVEVDLSSVPDATVLPGLIDSHLHLAISGADQGEKANAGPLVSLRMAHNALANLRAGITTVRDLGAKEHIDAHFKRGLDLGLVPGPRYLIAGRPIIATGGHCTYMGRQVDGPYEARKATREQLAAGVDWVKMMVTGGIMTRGTDPRKQQLQRDEIEAVTEAAHAVGTPVAAHCQGGPGIVDAIAAGVDSIEHGIWLTDEAIDLMLERNTAYVPTLSAIYLIAQGAPVAGVEPPPWSVEKAAVATDAHRESFAKAVDAGVRIVAGTDYRHGSLPYELSLMVEWGMQPIDALRSATSRAAELLSLPNVGTLAPGKEADLIVTRGNPIEDIAALEEVLLVIQAGEIVHRHESLPSRTKETSA